MKTFLLVLAAVIVAVGCTKDEPIAVVTDNTEQVKAALAGGWEVMYTNIYWNGDSWGDADEPSYWSITPLPGNRVIVGEAFGSSDTCIITAPYGSHGFRIRRETDSTVTVLLGSMQNANRFTGKLTDTLVTGIMTYDVTATKLQ